MNLRYITAILAAILGFITTMLAGWVLTEIEYLELMLIALAVYFAVYMTAMVLTEPKKERHERTRWELQTFDLRTGGR